MLQLIPALLPWLSLCILHVRGSASAPALPCAPAVCPCVASKPHRLISGCARLSRIYCLALPGKLSKMETFLFSRTLTKRVCGLVCGQDNLIAFISVHAVLLVYGLVLSCQLSQLAKQVTPILLTRARARAHSSLCLSARPHAAAARPAGHRPELHRSVGGERRLDCRVGGPSVPPLPWRRFGFCLMLSSRACLEPMKCTLVVSTVNYSRI